MITVLLSHERSGSHLLGEFLATAANIHMYDEVCNANAVNPSKHEVSFFRFQSNFIRHTGEEYFVPTHSAQMTLGKNYFEFLLARQKNNNIVIDIKYGHVRNFDWFWTPIFRRPLFFDICKDNSIKILHLYRENVVEAAISAAIAQKRQIWHSWQLQSGAENERYSIDPDEVVREALLLREQIHWIRHQWLPGCQNHEITYETLTSSLGSADRDPLDAVARFAGGSAPAQFAPKLKKLGRHPREQLSNADNLRAACEKSGLGNFVAWEAQ
jgi:hypothetical protein